MKFLQKILHLTLIVSIFLAPMDLSWAMEEEIDEGPTPRKKQDPRWLDLIEKDKELEYTLAHTSEDEEEVVEGDYLVCKPKDAPQDYVGALEELLKKHQLGAEKVTIILEELKESRNRKPTILDDQKLTPLQVQFKEALSQIGITDRLPVLLGKDLYLLIEPATTSQRRVNQYPIVSQSKETDDDEPEHRDRAPLPEVSEEDPRDTHRLSLTLGYTADTPAQEEEEPLLPPQETPELHRDITDRSEPSQFEDLDTYPQNTNRNNLLFFNSLDETFWSNLVTSKKTKAMQIVSAILGFSPPLAFVAMIMFEGGYLIELRTSEWVKYQDVAENVLIGWLTATLGPTIARQFYERAGIICRVVFQEERFNSAKKSNKDDPSPHVYGNIILHKVAKGALVLVSGLHGFFYLVFFALDVENKPTTTKGISFTVCTGIPLFLFYLDLFYSYGNAALENELRKYYYEESQVVGHKRSILLERHSEVRKVINHSKATQFINSLFDLIVEQIKELNTPGSLVKGSMKQIVAVTALLFKNIQREFLQDNEKNEEKDFEGIETEDLGAYEIKNLISNVGDIKETFHSLKEKANFQDDLNTTRAPSWWKRSLGFVGWLIPGFRTYTQFTIIQHLASLMAEILGCDHNTAEYIGYGISGVITPLKTIIETPVIKKWFESRLSSIFSLNQDMVEIRKVGTGTSLTNAGLLSFMETAIAYFASPDLNLSEKIFHFGFNFIGTVAVFETFLSEKTDHLITGAFTWNCLQSTKDPRIKRVFLNYWLDELEKLFKELDGKSIEMIYSKTQNAD